jgi:hypothetical protein
MEKAFFENAVDTLEILVSAMGAGLAVWGIINLLEAYEVGAARDEIAAGYRSRIRELELSAQRVSDDYAAGKIPFSRYHALCTECDAEIDELLEALYGLDAEIAAQKEQAVNQILNAGSMVLVAPIIQNPDNVQYALDYVDKKRHASGFMPV